MIVVCSTCQARFKVADEKIGPRGAKVRCSKCQTVFVVHKELGVMSAEPPAAPEPAVSPPPAHPGFDLDLEGAPGAGVRPNGFAADPFGRAAQPPAPVPDPFAAAAPPEAQPQFGDADPFQAAPPAPPGAAADPFAAHDALTAASGGGFGATDPFVARVEPAGPGLPTSAMTDLSDLLGSSAGALPAMEPPPASPAPTPPPEPSGILETGFDFDPSAGAELGLEVPAPAAATPPPSAAPPSASDDLALDERTPSPVAAAPMPGFGDFAGADPFADQDAAPGPVPGFEEGGELDAFGGPPEPRPQQASQPRPEAPAPAEAPPPPVLGAQPATVETTDEAMARSGGFQRSRIKVFVVNAVALVALLAVALGILALWRGVRPGAPGLLRPAEMLGTRGAEPFVTSQVRSGVYERSDATPLLFVSGVAASHAPGPVAGLRVRVEVVRHGAVVARGEARAGAVPTPEDLYGTRDAAGLASAMERSAARAPASVDPGESVPFLVAIADYPADTAGAGIVISVEPADAPPPAPAAPVAAPALQPAPAAPEGPKKP